MANLHLRFDFPPDRAVEPVIYRVVKDFDVVPNIHAAAIVDGFGWMLVDLSGTDEALENAVHYVEALGISVTSAEGQI